MGWFACGLVCLFVYGKMRGEKLFPTEERDWIVIHAVTFVVMQWMTIKIFQHTLLSYAFVFFQLGMVLQVIAGRFLFREPHFGRRMLGCVIMSIGAALIVWRG